MIQIVKFEEFHIDLIQPREYEKNLIRLMGDDYFRALVRNYARNSIAFTAIKDGEVLCCGGVMKLWKKVGEVWIFSSESMNDNLLCIAKILKRYFKNEFNDFDRIQAAVNSNFEKATRLAEWVGMEKEGILRKFGPEGEDYVIYGRVK